VQTTVPFKPTQGRPVLCRHCFQLRNRSGSPAPATTETNSVLLTEASADGDGRVLSQTAAQVAAAVMASPASLVSSVSTEADLASISGEARVSALSGGALPNIPMLLMAAQVDGRGPRLGAGELPARRTAGEDYKRAIN
jgi:hypothetical protein